MAILPVPGTTEILKLRVAGLSLMGLIAVRSRKGRRVVSGGRGELSLR
jgi:hypothetical protein